MKVAFCFSRLNLDPGVGSAARQVATDQALGHHTFQPLMADLREECLAGADHPLRKDPPGMGASLDQLLQSFPPRAERQGGSERCEEQPSMRGRK